MPARRATSDFGLNEQSFREPEEETGEMAGPDASRENVPSRPVPRRDVPPGVNRGFRSLRGDRRRSVCFTCAVTRSFYHPVPGRLAADRERESSREIAHLPFSHAPNRETTLGYFADILFEVERRILS